MIKNVYAYSQFFCSVKTLTILYILCETGWFRSSIACGADKYSQKFKIISGRYMYINHIHKNSIALLWSKSLGGAEWYICMYINHYHTYGTYILHRLG